jgi:hypothetical protein
MKQYVIDQLRPRDYEQVLEFLEENVEKTALDGIYWVNLPEDLCTTTQREHGRCRPHYFAINLDINQVAFELLIRSKQVLRCSCIAYATQEQRDFIIRFADMMLEKLSIKI